MLLLLYKEFRLAVNPLYLLVTLFGSLLLIPQWPYFIAMMYIFFITIPNVFMYGKAQNDLGYTLSLPVRKADLVYARIASIGILEVAQVLVAACFAWLSRHLYPAGNALLDANLAFLGCSLAMYGLFNAVFFPLFYKTAYKVAVPLFAASTAILLFAAAIEVLALLVPGAAWFLDGVSPEALGRQWPLFGAGILAYLSLSFLAARRSAFLFERVDL